MLEVSSFDLHGVAYRDVTVRFTDDSIDTARLGPESVPDGLQAGDKVVAMRAANMIVSLRRPDR